MDNLWVKLAEQAPFTVIIVLTFFFFLNYLGKQDDKRMAHEKDMEQRRTDNAKEREKERRDHELVIANMQANNMKQLIDNIIQSVKEIATALNEHEQHSKERYEKMGITKDLLDAAKERERERRSQ